MLYADIEITDEYDRKAGRRDWIRVERHEKAVSLSRDYASRRHERRVDPEAGLCFNVRHLNAIIDALVVMRDELRQSEGSEGT